MLVVLAPPTGSARATREVLEAWGRSHLLRRLVWWEASSAHPDGREVTVIDERGGTLMDLAAALEGWAEDLDVVAFAPASMVDDASSVDDFLSVVEERHQLLHRILDVRDLPIVAVVAPEPGRVSPGERVFSQRWRHIVLLAPDDRRSPLPRDVNRLVADHPAEFARHLAGQLACLGRLWREVDQEVDPLSMAMEAARRGADALAHAGERTATLVRGFTRLADGGYLIDHVAAQAMRSAGRWPLPRGLGYREVEEWPAKREYLAKRWEWEHRVVWGEVEETPPDERRSLSVLEFIRLFFRTVWRYLVLWPIRFVAGLLCRGYNALATLLERLPGMSGRHIRRCGERDRQHHRPEPPGPPPSRDPDGAIGAAWTDLRELAIGLVDASRLPRWVGWTDPNRPDQRQVVTDPNLVVPDPEELVPEAMASLLDVPVPRCCDPRAVLSLMVTLTALLELARAHLAEVEANAPVDDAGDEGPKAVEPPVAGGPGAGDPSSTDPPEEAAEAPPDEPGDDPAEVETPPPPDELTLAQRAVLDLEDAVARLAEWIGAAETSLLWSVGARLWQRLDDAERAERAALADLEAFERALASVDEEAVAAADARLRRRRRLVRWVRMAATVVAIGGGVAIWRAEELDRLRAGLVVVAIWLVVVLAAGLLSRRARRAVRAAHGQLAELGDPQPERRRLRAECERTWAHAERLRRRYHEFLDWGDILGWLLHHPWAHRSATGTDLPEPLDPDSLPASFDVAAAAMSPRELEDLVKLARIELFDKGWLDEVYDGIVDLINKELMIERGVEDPYVAPHDPSAEASPRLRLLDAVAHHRHESVRETTMTARVAAFLAAREPATTFPLAMRVKEGASLAAPAELPPIAQWRAAPPELADLTASVRPAVVKVLTGAGGGSGVAIDEAGLVVTNAHVVAGARLVEVRLDDQSMTSGRVVLVSDRTDLALIRVERPPSRFVQLGQWDGVRQGQPIFTVGFPELLEGEPTTSWGIVAAKSRIEPIGDFRRLRVFQHDAAARGGASGSGVFDLECGLIGVHVGGVIGSDYIKFAIPVDDVAELVEDYHSTKRSTVRSSGPAPTAVVAPQSLAVGTADPTEHQPGVEPLAAFFSDVTEAPAGHLQHDFWRAERADLPDDAALTSVVVTPAPNLAAPTPRFGRPWRLQAVRIEMTRPAPLENLTWFSDGEASTASDDLDPRPPPPAGPEVLA